MGDFVTQDILKCSRCDKDLHDENWMMIVVHHGKVNKEWKDARVVEVCPKCRKALKKKENDRTFTDYVFNNKLGVLKEIKIDESGKTIWRNKKY